MSTSWRPATRYSFAVLIAATAILLRWSIDPYVGDRVPFVFLMVAVLVVSTRVGFGPAIATLVVGCLATTWLFLPPRHSFAIEGLGYQVSLVAFSCLGLAIAFVGERLRRAHDRAQAYENFLADDRVCAGDIYVTTPRGVRHLVADSPFVRSQASAKMDSPANTLGRIIGEVIPEMAEDFDSPQWQVFANGKPVANIESQDGLYCESGTLRKWVVTYINPNSPDVVSK